MKNSSMHNSGNATCTPKISKRPKHVMIQKLVFATSVFILVAAMFGTIYHVRFGKIKMVYVENKKIENPTFNSNGSGNTNHMTRLQKKNNPGVN